MLTWISFAVVDDMFVDDLFWIFAVIGITSPGTKPHLGIITWAATGPVLQQKQQRNFLSDLATDDY